MSVSHEVIIDFDGNKKVLKLTARKAILHHCKECMGFEASEVRHCTVYTCALYPFRTHDKPV